MPPRLQQYQAHAAQHGVAAVAARHPPLETTPDVSRRRRRARTPSCVSRDRRADRACRGTSPPPFADHDSECRRGRSRSHRTAVHRAPYGRNAFGLHLPFGLHSDPVFDRRTPRRPACPHTTSLAAGRLTVLERSRSATQVVHAAALRFLYRITLQQPELAARVPRPRRPQTLPTVLSVQEVGQVLGAITAPKYRALFLTCYGAGLRIGEACALEPTDIDSTRMLLHVRHGKGGHERYVTLSPRLLAALRAYWRQARPRGPYR